MSSFLKRGPRDFSEAKALAAVQGERVLEILGLNDKASLEKLLHWPHTTGQWIKVADFTLLALMKAKGFKVQDSAADRVGLVNESSASLPRLFLGGDWKALPVLFNGCFDRIILHAREVISMDAVEDKVHLQRLSGAGCRFVMASGEELAVEAKGQSQKPSRYCVSNRWVGPVLVNGLADDRYVFDDRELHLSTRLSEPERSWKRLIPVPKFGYDLGDILHAQGLATEGGLLLSFADAYRENLPKRVSAFKGKRVLFIGDTHHGRQPLRRMLQYLSEEPYDFVISLHNPQHLHFLAHMVEPERLGWLPNFNLMPNLVDLSIRKKLQVCFSGRLGTTHPVRTKIVQQLKESDLSFTLGEPEDAEQLHSQSLLALNLSLNGDFNLRTFGIIGCGAGLVSDALRPQQGLSTLFELGKEYETFTTFESLCEVLKRSLEDAEATKTKALRATKRYWAHYRPEKMRERLSRLLHGDALEGAFSGSFDPRTWAQRAVNPDALERRLVIYEAFQEWHRISSQLHILVAGDIDPCIVTDLSDLPRLEIDLWEEGQDLTEIKRALAICRIDWIRQVNASTSRRHYDLVMLGSDAIGAFKQSNMAFAFDHVLIPDTLGITAEAERRLSQSGLKVVTPSHASCLHFKANKGLPSVSFN